ncbi:hypothetical protein [Halolamina sp.]|jgi:hypothetical protein|uniref:DUF7410 domain-containing protein n=1 Tax=Halolamina sp. TaxID=1940283 RepID=UPI000223B510|nr:hypothetical protein Halar_1661 [halophilic archaeon DL31]
MSEQLTPDQFTVDDSEAEYCPYCGRPLASEHLWALHVGEHHPDAMTEAETETYEAANEQESDDLFVFHIKVMAIITLVTFVFIYTYTFVWL